MGWGAEIKAGLSPVVDLVFPPRCPVCGDAVAAQGGLCITCWSDIEQPREPACADCARPLGSSHAAGEQCWLCRENPPRHSGIVAASIYNDTSRQLILRFKHGRKIALAGLLGRLMAMQLDDAGGGGGATDAGPPLLIPVPLHRLRIWERGFNQAALLAGELAKHRKGDLVVDALVRRKRTPSLGGLGREARRSALSGAICVRKSRLSLIRESDVLLVDDVLTSGATSNACVDALMDAGARSVRIICFARVVDG